MVGLTAAIADATILRPYPRVAPRLARTVRSRIPGIAGIERRSDKTNAPFPLQVGDHWVPCPRSHFLQEEQSFGYPNLAESKDFASPEIGVVRRRFRERLRQHYFRGSRKTLLAYRCERCGTGHTYTAADLNPTPLATALPDFRSLF